MLKRMQGPTIVAAALLLAGCATTGGRNYQSDIDSLNAKVSALQGQLSAKDQEISSLQSQVNDERMAKEAAEAAARRADDEKRAAAGRAASKKAAESDLK